MCPLKTGNPVVLDGRAPGPPEFCDYCRDYGGPDGICHCAPYYDE